ncbi:hypothetical protein GLOIN_2v1506419 [Rhizophagus irregularis DAOM 181602=DAOM 197198]|uniref:Uncharacterized protein n=2 Tax=Rhizophagus irregularis TaxID=588596 RepID=A0A015MCL9_RHIIW|nr:hypothetical protein RirG_141570 [Rhizophagus irregularis DAOM 197198w]GBC39747.1 hypothetical protein GLOIN_2v1506419 [Rhizophagus irregularis DAOM 181602=DAOM 197198]
MEVLETPVGKRTIVKNIIQDIPRTLQIPQADLFTKGQKTELFDDNFRWSENCTEHSLGCPLSVLHDQYRTNYKNFEIPRGTDKFSLSIPETISEMGSTLGDRISSNAICDQCDVEVQAAEDHQLFIWGVTNRLLQIQTSFSRDATKLRPRAQTSSPTGRGKECDSEKRGLGLRQLCREQPIGTFSTLKTKLTNLTSFDFNERAESQATLRKLSCDLEAQYSHDVPSLLNILKSFYPFNETSGDVLEDYEINDFFKLYDISNVRPILASNDNYVFWLEDPAGIIYMWSRVEWSMSYLGRELREALVNYLFHQDNICYVVEFTHEIIPKNEIKQQAKELADSCEPIDIDDIEWKVTRESLNPIKRNEKKGIKKGKNKGKKKKKKH